MATRDLPPTIRPLRGTTEENLLFVGPVGAVTVDTDLLALRVHDGTTPGGKVFESTSGGEDFDLLDGGTLLAPMDFAVQQPDLNGFVAYEEEEEEEVFPPVILYEGQFGTCEINEGTLHNGNATLFTPMQDNVTVIGDGSQHVPGSDNYYFHILGVDSPYGSQNSFYLSHGPVVDQSFSGGLSAPDFTFIGKIKILDVNDNILKELTVDNEFSARMVEDYGPEVRQQYGEMGIVAAWVIPEEDGLIDLADIHKVVFTHVPGAENGEDGEGDQDVEDGVVLVEGQWEEGLYLGSSAPGNFSQEVADPEDETNTIIQKAGDGGLAIPLANDFYLHYLVLRSSEDDLVLVVYITLGTHFAQHGIELQYSTSVPEELGLFEGTVEVKDSGGEVIMTLNSEDELLTSTPDIQDAYRPLGIFAHWQKVLEDAPEEVPYGIDAFHSIHITGLPSVD